MIEFHAGSGPDSQAVGIALEEMFLDYRIMPMKAPLPVISFGGARLVDAGNILMALARKTGRFLPDAAEAAPWLSKSPPDDAQLAALLADGNFILGVYSIVDMAAYPRRTVRRDLDPAIAAWIARVELRSAVGRGMVVVSG